MNDYIVVYVTDEKLHAPYAFIECEQDGLLAFVIRESALLDAAVLADAWGKFRKMEATRAAA